jgi:primosomal protein N' (replication factor Y)
VLARERAHLAGVDCLLVSATPTLDLLADEVPQRISPELERAGWPRIEILDRRGDDPRSGLFAPPLTEIVRGARREEPGRPVVAVLNRIGRARLLACAACGSLVACERCGAALREHERGGDAGSRAASLICPRCDLVRPWICQVCHSTRLKSLRLGVSRVAEELAALIGEPAAEVTAATVDLPRAGLLVGTEAVLHRVRAASLVIWLDFDQELGVNRLRGAEEALALLARSGRLVGPRSAAVGYRRRVVVQTRVPGHLVLAAALAGDPGIFSAAEAETRRSLRLPPFAAVALISGEDADEVAGVLASRSGVEVGERRASGYLVRASDAGTLADALAASQASAHQLRVEVDPIRV